MVTMPPTFGLDVATGPPGDQFALLHPAVVGEQVAEAILNDTFMLYTDDKVRDVLVERVSDWDAFIAKQTEGIDQSAAG